MHIEGSLEPEMMFALARRNRMAIPFDSVEALRGAYNFSRLPGFSRHPTTRAPTCCAPRQDFHDLALAYFDRAAADAVRHAEIFFDPQTHTARGIPFQVVADGLLAGMSEAKARHGLTSKLDPLFPSPSSGSGRLRHA